MSKMVQYGKYAQRRNYSRVKSNVELPNLIKIQTESFEWFVKEGLRELFEDISPITNFNEDLALHFGEYEFEPAKYSIKEAKERDVNYSKPLRVQVKLENRKTGEIKESSVFMGNLQMMTPEGTFVVNGAERVIVTQIVRSAGVFYGSETDKKTGKVNYTGQVIPTRGAWLEFESDSKEILYVKLDRSKKIPITTLLRALGISDDKSITKLLGHTKWLENTLEKDSTRNSEDAILEVYSKLRQGEQATIDGARNFLVSRLFDAKRYDLAKVGRYKVNKKLDVLERAIGFELTKDLTDTQTGEVLVEANTLITPEVADIIKANRHLLRETVELDANLEVGTTTVEVIHVNKYEDNQKRVIKLIGNNNDEDRIHIVISDILASISYYFNLYEGAGHLDNIDHLGNRRLRLIGELIKNQFRIGLTKMEKNIKDRMSTNDPKEMTPQNLINIRPLTSSMKEFFGSSQLSQFMDQINPLAELTNKRRISALGPGGLSRDRAGFEVRDVHFSHYGRVCPIETPEGPNIGLINSLATYAEVDDFGFIKTPYFKFSKSERRIKFDSPLLYLTADEEEKYTIAQANINVDDNGKLQDGIDDVVARRRGETKMFPVEEIDLVDVSPKQIVSVSTACIPFLEHDDANRALMGANMQRQAIPLLKPDSPFVGTGMEYKAAADSGSAICAKNSGKVIFVDSKQIQIETTEGNVDSYELIKFTRSNQSTCINQKPIVSFGDQIEAGMVIADGPSMDKGELALGQNPVVAFMTWNGYNYEDAIIMSQRLVKEDVYTSIHIEEYEVETRDTKLGKEEITTEIPNVGPEAKKYLDADGIIIPGAEVKEGDILVGKVTPKGQTDPTPEEKLLLAIFGEKSREVRDSSLRVPHGGGGIVHSVKYFSRANGDELPPGVNEVIRIYIVQKRKISEGDKMAGRHGNKGVISKILPVEDMPYMADGTPVDILLNPLGVPSRMNIGQVLELHLGMAARTLGIKVATPVFDGIKSNDLEAIMQEAGMSPTGKIPLWDGQTGEKYENEVSVGVMYMVKLAHMVDDKLHARSVGPYTLVTQQPMGGKAQNGGQRFGEMEVWALEAYGAAYILQEMLTVKSDDIIGRNKVFRAIIDGKPIPAPALPESFRVLAKELQALCINVELISKESGEDVINKSLVEFNEDDNYLEKYGFDQDAAGTSRGLESFDDEKGSK